MTTKVNIDWLAAGRGKSRISGHPLEEALALELKYFAHSDPEERLLIRFRAMAVEHQAALVEFLDRLS
jgi:PIN domain nuclease of toxin-antitoxin system